IPPDILRALKKNKAVWKNFQNFPESYKRIRIGWIDASRNRPDFFRKRLQYFLRMTRENKRFGMVQ
ncbi:MAG: YdeI/OmpD-associated family protein, partial [Bacteroidota bacterium]